MWLCSRSLLYCTSFRENLDRFQSLNVYKLISSAHSLSDISKQKLQWYFQDVVDILSLARYRPSVKDRMKITSCVHHLLLKIISYRFYIFLRVVCSVIQLVPFRSFMRITSFRITILGRQIFCFKVADLKHATRMFYLEIHSTPVHGCFQSSRQCCCHFATMTPELRHSGVSVWAMIS